MSKKDEFTVGDAFAVPAGDGAIVGWVNLSGPIDRSGGDAAFIIALMSKMTDEQRVEVINRICGEYCAGCGTRTGGRMCQCGNDE